MKEPWQIAAARFCVEKGEFSLSELEKFLENEPHNVPHESVRHFFNENIQNPPGRQFGRDFRKGEQGGIWTAPAELVSMIIDFDELREARRNSSIAFRISMAALAVSALGTIFQYLSLR